MPPMNDDLDLSRPLRALKRFTWLVLLLSLAAGAVTYLLSSRQTPVYQAKTLILSAGSQTSNPSVGNTVVSPPPLPAGAIEGALQSENVLGVVRRRLAEVPELTRAQRIVLADRLAQDIASGRGRVFDVSGQQDIYGNGTYTLSATHRDPVVAARLANLAADALVDWDTERGLVKVNAAINGLRTRLADVERRLAAAGPVVGTPTSLQQTLLAQRANRLDALNNLTALRETVVGSLSVVAPAAVPLKPVAPKPLRNAVLVGGFVLLLLSALLVLWSSVNRMVASDADLKFLNLRLLGEVPRVRLLRRGQSLLVALRQGRWSDSVAFLAAGVKSVLPKGERRPPVLLVTSLFSGDGKSNISAAIADARVASGDRVLLIDADLRRPSQASIWQAGAQTAEWVDLPGAVPFPGEESRDLLGALDRPVTAQARRLRDNLHLLAPAPGMHAQTQAHLPAERFREAMTQWGAGYDLIVVDGPPALAVADPLVLAPHAAGVLLVLEAGRASVASVQRVLDALLLVNANVLGVALNKVNPRGQVARYGYGYARRSTPAAAPKPESRVL
ncbi:exoP (plasmid) [Deinococcus aetherius]|uniref:ExoP n=1 Tax=Deinococcus aetherius TaxID=200252 RepID=A0ABM8AHV6_9DEIO|nr:tyrosine-protein kinase domain-containing protein [Deinococcus aetherius]BDP43395.1 exoP [Deinococcus aetherius]